MALAGGSTVHLAPTAAHVTTTGATTEGVDAPKTAVPDTDNVQQGGTGQSGAQSGAQDTTGVDTPGSATAVEAGG
jgi:hypothetical protein